MKLQKVPQNHLKLLKSDKPEMHDWAMDQKPSRLMSSELPDSYLIGRSDGTEWKVGLLHRLVENEELRKSN